MDDKIETTDELRQAVRAVALAFEFDVRIDVRALRQAWNVTDAIDDPEIDRTVTEILRSDDNPEVVFVLGGGMLVAQLCVPVDGDYSIGDELWQAASHLSVVHGRKVSLTSAPASACGFGILTAYRMPPGDYEPGDWPLVERFGIERGKYRQSSEPVAT